MINGNILGEENWGECWAMVINYSDVLEKREIKVRKRVSENVITAKNHFLCKERLETEGLSLIPMLFFARIASIPSLVH